ncbi:MAG: DUF192 domain-containing protein [Bacteroidetes bacterium]|nr:DUF192 domain-containing protein [Bacteroidota bacterium]
MRTNLKFPFLFFVFAFFIWQCGSDTGPANTTTQVGSPTNTPPNQVSKGPQEEPQFVQEGILEFYSPDGARKLQRFEIEIAHSEKEREQGLMYRKHMEDSQGMLFVFEEPDEQSFWMHNTYIPLDIIYLDENGVVVSLHKNCRPLNDTPLPSGKEAQYVVELNGGASDKIGLKVGCTTQWRDFITNQNKGNLAF